MRIAKRVLMILTMLFLLTDANESFADVVNGNARITPEAAPIVRAVFPPCPDVTAHWCYWDGGDLGPGWAFVDLGGYVVTFD